MKIAVCFLLFLSSCKDLTPINTEEYVVVFGAREFHESDLVKLKAEAPATLTRNGSARLLFDLLRAEHVINGSSKSEVTMKDRLMNYDAFIKKFPDAELGLRKLEEIKVIAKGPCFQRD